MPRHRPGPSMDGGRDPIDPGGLAMSDLGEILPEINWRLIIFTLLLSSVVALLGDILGMKIAKKRITLLG
ncbi:MAG: DUF3084 domain-containing protein, partial [Synergistales bacterium]|nr:DUF3084 domain-containing protein [Synergistales bacterium]